MSKGNSTRIWKILGICIVAVAAVLAAAWIVLSILFPQRVFIHLEGVVLNAAGERTAAVELSFSGEWNPRLVQAVCGEKTGYEYSGELTVSGGGDEEKLSVAAEPQSGVYDGWRDVLCLSSGGGAPGKPLTMLGKEVGPLVFWQEKDSLMMATLTAPNGETFVLLCSEQPLTDEDVARACMTCTDVMRIDPEVKS